MSDKFGKRIEDYKDIYFMEKIHYYEIYGGYNKKLEKDVSLKLIKKEEFKDKKLLFKKVENEKEILEELKKCKCENILDFYRFFETKDNIIIEQEYYHTNLREYLMENGPSNYNLEFFKEVILGISNALLILHKKGVIHRNIRTSSLFLIENRGKNKIKLGEFGTAIFIKDNVSEPLNSIFYTAPEIINGEKYDEKCDLWSFGISLYELYFGTLPFGFKPSRVLVTKALSDESSFHFEKTNIPSIDNLFEGLLKINPKKRMTHEELFKLVFNKNFMNENETTLIKKKSSSDIILKSLIFQNNDFNPDESLSDGSITLNKEKEIYNNILYYDESLKKNVKNDCDKFEKETLGGFIKCSNMVELEQVKKDILNENKKCNDIKFNLIITGSTFEKIMEYIQDDKTFEKCFENYCIYCRYIQNYEYLKDYYSKLKDIYNITDDVIQFIKNKSNNKIRPFIINKILNEKNNIDEYLRMINFYKTIRNDDNNQFNQYFEEIKNYIMSKEIKLEMKNILLEAFKVFGKNHDNLIIKKFTNILYNDFNNFIDDTNVYSKDCIEYFKARILKSFGQYNGISKFQWNDNPIYMVKKLYYSDLLKYKMAKGIIFFKNFLKFYKSKESAYKNIYYSHSNDDNLKFNAIFVLKNDKKLENSSGFNINENEKEESVLYLPFSLFKIGETKIDLSKMAAEINLEII